MSGLDLGSQARRFAQVLQDVLNRTVCDNAQVNAVINNKTKSAHIGTRLSRTDFMTDKVQMRSRARTKIWLDVSSVWYRNDEGFLTARSTYCGVYLGDAHEQLLLHYDYEREKDLYTEAHIQVAGTHPALERMLEEVGRSGDHMKDLHLPVGGRRLRPSLEDLLESLIAERLLDPKSGYEKVLNDSRRDYRIKQISALVRSNQETAAAALRSAGWEVTKKSEEGFFSGFRKHRGR
ncbi:hypothetical protein [Paractinoplanes toevensis]|uniref:Uncharacterized protein n=1 Tax=Paractinoplanes toevensis TaxID=571911 RepID=A0A919WBL7_9ACTN|nr:hypothetical protein [Actinoplanes toevensis]GIM97135.1 hypothetical protein Ato02nite_089280 [Actinoplanes toevensis]